MFEEKRPMMDSYNERVSELVFFDTATMYSKVTKY